MKRAVMVVLSVLTVVLSINTASNLLMNHSVSLHAASTWDGTLSSDTFTVRTGGRVNLPIPEKFEHTFAGWYRDEAHTKPFNPARHRVKRNTTLHARFTPNSYTITLIDPSQYLNKDGTRNLDYTPQTVTRPIGTRFIFPDAPRVPAASENLGAFKGWSLSMQYNQYLNTNSGGVPDTQTNIVAQPGTRYENFFRQNATYWAAWETWELPGGQNLPQNIYIDFRMNFPHHGGVGVLDINLDTNPITPTMENRHFYRGLPLTLISMFFETEDNDHAYFTVLNNGLTSYSFGGWALTPTTTANTQIYRDGEALHLGPFADYIQEINGRRTLTFYAVWIES